ncbi:hypothetical protein [Hydrogenophaga sp.]|uniref:hypothetical protein n=1 Tax=Hydrogenophaga sp. TaxID=1904254 RepID=UPI002731D0C5|nr:hypothetical protein [Hydrogenophaga sp.]MDP2018509.1 hypothetical protein [Hydrogenophaga sp.]MDP3164996.1 hypothetical protein [Hydrogenophaga sp.]
MNRDEQTRGEEAWAALLLAEARRDLVFVFHIAGGAFGGPKDMSSEDLPAAIERMARALVKAGCIVGFGDPDSPSWNVPANLEVPRSELPVTISRLWSQDPETHRFIAFALRQ